MGEIATDELSESGIVSDILNSFLGAAYGAYLGMIAATSASLEFMIFLFFMTILTLCGAILMRMNYIHYVVVVFSIIWGLNLIQFMRLGQGVQSGIIFSCLLATFWISVFNPRIFNWITGRRGV